jgi:hypothetical protein
MNRATVPITIGAIAGIAFSVLYFLSTASFDPKVEATDAELVAFFSDSSNLRDNVISMYLALASIPCFLLFLVTLRRRLAAAEGEDATGSTFVLASGVCFAATLLVASVARGLIAHSVKFGDKPLSGPDTLRTITLFHDHVRARDDARRGDHIGGCRMAHRAHSRHGGLGRLVCSTRRRGHRRAHAAPDIDVRTAVAVPVGDSDEHRAVADGRG